MNPTHLDRRDMFKRLLALSAVGTISACSGAQETPPADTATDTPDPPPEPSLEKNERERKRREP